MNSDTRQAALEWLLNGETGASSENIVRFLFTGKATQDYPRDPADLRRCVVMMDTVGRGIREEFFMRMGEVSSIWKELIKNWVLLETTLHYEMGKGGKTAPKTYNLMEELILRGSIEGGPKREIPA